MTVEKAQAKIIRALERQVRAQRRQIQLRGAPGDILEELSRAEGAERAARHALKEAT